MARKRAGMPCWQTLNHNGIDTPFIRLGLSQLFHKNTLGLSGKGNVYLTAQCILYTKEFPSIYIHTQADQSERRHS